MKLMINMSVYDMKKLVIRIRLCFKHILKIHVYDVGK